MTVPPVAFQNAQPGLRNGTEVSAAVTVVHSTVVVATSVTSGRLVATAASAAGAASATGAFSGTNANSIAMFEGGALVMAANLGMVLLGAVAVVLCCL